MDLPTHSRFPIGKRPVTWLISLVTVLAIFASAATAFSDSRWCFLAAGLWALAIVLVPVAREKSDYDPFSTWSFALLTILIGVTLRGASLSLGFPDEERLDRLFFLGKEPEFFFAPAGWLLLGLAMLCLGWMAFRIPRRTILKPFRIHSGRLISVCLVLFAISAAATVLYILRTGGFSSGEISAKRTVIPGLELEGSGYQSHGGLRFAASLAMFGHVILLAALLSPGQRKNFPLWLLAIALLALACVVPFYASLRTPVAMNLVMSAAMVFYAGRQFRRTAVSIAVLAALIGIYLMTALRPSQRDVELARPTVVRLFEAAVINRNQIDVPKTAHILDAIDAGELAPQYGMTIARWAIAPIPRSLWPDKPVIPPGPEIGQTVYGQRVAGVPPSMVAELWWNFSLAGVFLGAFAIGAGLRWIDARFRPDSPSHHLFLTALYVAGPMTIAFEMVGGSLGSGIFRAALHTAVMLGLLMLIASPSSGGPKIEEASLRVTPR